MSDYLSRLVGRVLEPTDPLQPRLASLFEPAAPGVSGPAGWEARAAPPNAGMRMGATDGVAPETVPFSSMQPAAPGPHGERVEREGKVGLAPKQEPTQTLELGQGREASPRSERDGPASAVQSEEGPAGARRARRAIGLPFSRADELSDLGKFKPVETERRTVATKPEVSKAESEERSVADRPRPSATAKARIQDTTLELPGNEDKDIHITIGQVEIRAVQASKPEVERKPRRRAKPVLSLEEYLRRRKREAGR